MSKKTIVVEQYASVARRPKAQEKILIGLGLNKVGRRRELEDTPAIRGMVKKVPHLVRLVEGRG